MNTNYFQFERRVNLATTVFYIILSALAAMKTFLVLFQGTRIGNWARRLLDLPEAEADSVTGGYETLARLVGGGISVIVAVAMIVFGVALIAVLGLGISMIVSGIRFRNCCMQAGGFPYKKLRGSAVYKVVINSVFLLGSVLILITAPSVFMGMCLVSCLTFEVLLIMLLVRVWNANKGGCYAGTGNIPY